MVMPNIGALIAFGFLAALFIDTGWIPHKGFNSMVGPMLTYLIPILIASTGGRMIGGDRGAGGRSHRRDRCDYEQYLDYHADGSYGNRALVRLLCEEV